ncbi:MAG: ABC transporter substrate-binding protein [Candidatus Magasanikbacteria bacterium]|jgi:branched-chain amino acid transport system substrate-binding protein
MNTFKKVVIGIVIIVIVVAIAMLGQKNKSSVNETVKVGVILPLSGQYAVIGESVKNAMLMSLNDLEDKNIELIFENDEFDSKKALSAYNKLQTVDNVDIIVGLSNPSLEVMKPIINKTDELMFTVGNEASIENDNVFEIIPWATELFKVLGTTVSGRYEKVAIVYAADSQLFSANKEQMLKGLGDQKYIEVPVASNSDTRTEVAKMVQEGVDSYTVFLTTDQASKFMNEVTKQSGLNRPQLICDANMELTINELSEKVIDKSIFNDCLSTMIKDTTSKDFSENYKKSYNSEPSFLSVYGYDAVQIISNNLVGKDKSDWRDILEKDNFSHTGLSGKIIFDETGSRVLESEVHTYKDGKFVKFEN